MSAPFIPAEAPFTEEQRAWIGGFLAGLAALPGMAGTGASGTGGTAAPSVTLEVLVGTQTGNSQYLAEDLATAARARGFGVTVRSLDSVTVEQLVLLPRVLVVCSTYGEGEMPDNAELFWEAISAESAPRLEGTEFAVLALGDTSYDDFCQAGRVIDTRFEQLGATRILPRVDCDVEYEDEAAAWIAAAVEQLAAAHAEALAAPVVTAAATATPPSGATPARSPWNRKTPFPAALGAHRRLSAPESAKEIRHYEFALAESGIAYEAGDALAVVPLNDPALVELLLAAQGLDGEQEVEARPLRELLHSSREISTPPKALLTAIAERDPEGELAGLLALEQKEPLENWLWGRDVLDLLQEARAGAGIRFTAEELIGLLRPLQHRAYSISSSPLASPDRIHLTVASVRYQGGGRDRGGVCSTFLADRFPAEQRTGIFLTPNAAFRVPQDDTAPAIMVGPGTGIAPFRAFLQERAGRGASGRNWLFFGDQHRAHDFIYEDELAGYTERGVLTRLDLAFSRDQKEKVYVQTRMREQGRELYAWLEEGGHFYVCGDASRMAKDVDDALQAVVAEHGARSPESAAEYVNELKRQKRYVRDVY